ncbi:ankyrin repeat domain-containing protein [Bacteroidota bacterium]
MKLKSVLIGMVLVYFFSGFNANAQEMFTAIENGDVAAIEILLIENPDLVNQANNRSMTPLNWAAWKNQPEVFALLLKKGGDPDIGDNENSTPFHHAAISGSKEIVDMLLEKGADINFRDDNGNSALLFALMYRQPDLASYLMEKGADVKVKSNRGWTTLQAATIGGNLDMVKALIENKVNPNTPINDGVVPLHSAVSFGHTEIVRYLIENGADVDYKNDAGDTPLSWALNPNTYDVAKILIENGADVNNKNQFNFTPLHNVAGRGTGTNVAELLLEKGADINALSLDGRSPLTFAAWSRDPDGMSKFLILNGANVNPEPCSNKACTCGPNFQTPLHAAARHGGLAMTQNLVSNGAKINVYDDSGNSTLLLAIASGNEELVEYLIDNGAFLNTKEKTQGSTELHNAAAMGYGDMANLLIEKGSDVNAPDKCGQTPLDYACRYKHMDIAYDMLANGADDSKLKDYLNAPDPLAEELGAGEASVHFLGHSAWAVKTQNHFLIFDYSVQNWFEKPDDSCFASGYIIPEEIKDLNVTVFSTHSHGDHYDPRMFNWANTIEDINYVLCWEARDRNPEEYTLIPVHGEQKVDDMDVYVHYSTDLGGGYLIEVDGLTILHMGDHANGEDGLMEAFTDEIDMIAEKDVDIDILFGGIRGCSLGRPEQVKKGMYYTVEKLNPELFVPMHCGAHSCEIKRFAEQAERDGIVQEMKCVFHKGDHFTYKKKSTSDMMTGL